jgi:hypothetical protein
MEKNGRDWSLQVSRLIDGELPVDQANALLAATFDDHELRQMLREQLRLHGTLGAWRELGPDTSAVDETASPPRLVGGLGRDPLWSTRTPIPILSGVLVGGLLVLAGFLAARIFHSDAEPVNGTLATSERAESAAPLFIAPEKQREVEAVFAMHEQLAGPLAWLADSAEQIQLTEAAPAQPQQAPVAILLQLQDASAVDGGGDQYVFVCREGAPATINVPFGGHPMRVSLLPCFDEEQGRIQLQYAMSISAADGEDTALAVLTGEQDLDLHAAPLGQFVVDNRLLSLQAGAWTF